MFSNRLFQFSYEILNAPSEKIMFLCNFCHLPSVCFMGETKVLMAASDFFYFFSRNHFLKGASFFIGGFAFQLGVGASFLSAVAPNGWGNWF